MFLLFFLLIPVLLSISRIENKKNKVTLQIIVILGIFYGIINSLFLFFEFNTPSVGSDALRFYEYSLIFGQSIKEGLNPFNVLALDYLINQKYFGFIIFNFVARFPFSDPYISFFLIRLNILLLLILLDIRILRILKISNLRKRNRIIIYFTLLILTLYGSSANFRDPIIALLSTYIFTEHLITLNKTKLYVKLAVYFILLYFFRDEFIAIIAGSFFLVYLLTHFLDKKPLYKYIFLTVIISFSIWMFLPLPDYLDLYGAIITHQEDTGLSRGQLLNEYYSNPELAGNNFSQRFIRRFPASLLGNSPNIFFVYYFNGSLEQTSWFINIPYFITTLLFRINGFFILMPFFLSVFFIKRKNQNNKLTAQILSFILIVLSIYSVYHLGTQDRIRLTIYPLMLIAYYSNSNYTFIPKKLTIFFILTFIIFSNFFMFYQIWV